MNDFGKTWDEYQTMFHEAISELRQKATDKLFAAGAHYVIDTLAHLLPLIGIINKLLANGERS